MKIGLISKTQLILDSEIEKIYTLSKKNKGELFFLDSNFVQENKYGTTLCEEIFYKTIEIAIVLGGDGTLLRSAYNCAKFDIPILGINFGRIGLLTDLENNDIEKIEKLFNRDYKIDERMMIEAVFKGDCSNEKKHIFTALNDFVISRSNSPKMLDLELYIDDELSTELRADGLIIATPTGSTAYSLSAGGSVIDPMANLIAVTPICPHTLKSRPLIISKKRKITIKHKDYHNELSYVSIDGAEPIGFERSMDIEIRVSKKIVKLVRINGRNFYSVLKEKL